VFLSGSEPEVCFRFGTGNGLPVLSCRGDRLAAAIATDEGIVFGQADELVRPTGLAVGPSDEHLLGDQARQVVAQLAIGYLQLGRHGGLRCRASAGRP
jgi:hypothetical protein